jgi:hypothetical protein
MANVCGGPGVPRSRGDPCGFGQDVVTAIGDVSEFLDGLVKAAARKGNRMRGKRAKVRRRVLNCSRDW